MIRFIENFDVSKLEEGDLSSIKLSSSLKDNLETIYEWEWKLNKIKNVTNISQKRKLNILDKVEKKLLPIANDTIKKLNEVFSDWLDAHDLDNQRNWAWSRVSLMYDENILTLEYTYQQYARYGNMSESEFIKDVLNNTYDNNSYVDDVLNDLKYDAETYIDDLESKDSLDDGEEGDLEYYKSVLDEYESYEKDIKGFIDYGVDNGLLSEDIDSYGTIFNTEDYIIIFQKIIFPVWMKHWKSKGINKTIKNVKQINSDLEKSLKSNDVSNKITNINIALHTQHQTGGMIDYVEEKFDVDYKDLDNLSNVSQGELKSWKKDLGMMGMIVEKYKKLFTKK